MELQAWIHSLSFCKEGEEKLQAACKAYDHAAQAPHWQKLYQNGKENEGIQELRAALAPDEDGMKMLACMLHCALYRTGALYADRGIPKEIFTETMRFLPRFVNAHAAAYGTPAFTWDRWFYRQLSLKEFRIGPLEYEMTEEGEERRISLHIPAGADLSPGVLYPSLRRARSFFAAFFPAYADAGMYCSSWMLSPALKELLPRSSRILAFQSLFTLSDWDRESDACLDWIFPRRDMPLGELAENTSLQKKAKAFLLSGGKIGWAQGKLKDPV